MKYTQDENIFSKSAETNFFKYMIVQVKKVQLKDIGNLGLLTLSFVPGKIWKIFCPDICVVSEYEYLARDNGYWFYKYLREKHPEIKAYYPIRKKGKDYSRIAPLGNIVPFSSFKHYMLFWAARKQFTSSKNAGFPSRICEDLVQWNFHRFEYVLLNHGITRGKSPIMDPTKTNYNYICTCSDLDRKIIIEDNGQKKDKVRVTGFARHDNLPIGERELTRKIIIMPTWRTWLNAKYVRDEKELKLRTEEFLKSKYYTYYMSVLNDDKLIKWLEENNIQVHFYLHDNTHFFKKYYSSTSSKVIFEEIETADIQQLLIEGDLLVTDYSSVCYDFAYMLKPVLYYQFDRDLFEKYQYKPGSHYTYEDNGLGEITYEPNELVGKIIEYYETGCVMPETYKERVCEYFAYRDKSNCERIFCEFLE